MKTALALLALLCAPAFAGSGSVTLTWTACTQNTDNTPLTNLAGYKVYFGKSATVLDQTINIPPTLTTYIVGSLDDATKYYFAMTCSNTMGQESARTGIVSGTTPAPPPPPSPKPPSGLTVTIGNQTAYVPQGANQLFAVTRVGVIPADTPCDVSQRLTLDSGDYYPVHLPDNAVQWSGTIKHAVLLLAKCS